MGLHTETSTEEGRHLPVGTVVAADVEQGMFLTGLDNGYVHSEPHADFRGDVVIEFHTAEGEEGTLTVPPDMPLMVSDNGKAH